MKLCHVAENSLSKGKFVCEKNKICLVHVTPVLRQIKQLVDHQYSLGTFSLSITTKLLHSPNCCLARK